MAEEHLSAFNDASEGTSATQTIGTARPMVFFSAHHDDYSWRDRIKAKLLDLGAPIELWDDSKLEPGDRWAHEITSAIRRASVAVILLSPDYLYSDTAKRELEGLFQRTARGDFRLFPIVVHACPWEQFLRLGEILVWSRGEPIDRLDADALESELEKIAKSILLALGQEATVMVSEGNARQVSASPSPDEKFRFSTATNDVLVMARQLSVKSGRGRVTSSCLLFAMASKADDRNDTARFLRDVLDQTKGYDAGFELFLGDGSKIGQEGIRDAGDPLGKVSSTVWTILIAAASISNRVYGRSRMIHLRHLLAALLVSDGNGPSPTIAVRLHKLGIQPQPFREEFRDYVRIYAPHDDQAEWDVILGTRGKTAPVPPPGSGPDNPPDELSQSKVEPLDNGYAIGPAGFTSEFCGVGGSRPVVDHLGMETSAHRLAELIALRETKLPLAVGLFGNWGSGKSHFMNLIDRHIKALADAERLQPADAPSKWCHEIVPVYFNAWHYLDANLWASLVSQIFDSLFSYLQPKQNALEKVQELLEQASGATARAAEEVAVAHTVTVQARSELSAAEETHRRQQTILAGLRYGLSNLLSEDTSRELQQQVLQLLGVRKDVETLDDLRGVMRESKSVRCRIRALWNSACERPDRGWRIGWVLAALGLVPLLTFGALRLLPFFEDSLQKLGLFLVSALASISALLTAVRPILRQVGRSLEKLEGWQKRAQDAQNSFLETPDFKKRVTDINAAAAKEQEAKIRLAQSEIREQQLMEEARNLAPGRRLGRFIEARAQSGDYRGQLGLVSLARRDFEELSNLFADTEALKDKVATLRKSDQGKARELVELSKSIDRIVLFVDDLDRCQPEKVVDVLQAVHLLLAFPLFAVVVGVDQRCLRQSLRLQFKGLLTPDQDLANGKQRADGNGSAEAEDNRPATPLDYLEKIFHVPFHLPSMGDTGFKTLIKELTKPPEPASAAQIGTGTAEHPGALPPVDDARKQSVPGGAATTQSNASGTHLSPASTAMPSRAPATAVAPSPVAVQSRPVIGSVPLHDWERQALESYHPLIGTPRGAKRLLNTYRLVRAGIPETEWNAFKGDGKERGEFRIAMLMLAAAAGYPAVAREWFELMRADKDFPVLRSLWSTRLDPAWLTFRSLYDETFVCNTPKLSHDLFCKWLDRVELFAF